MQCNYNTVVVSYHTFSLSYSFMYNQYKYDFSSAWLYVQKLICVVKERVKWAWANLEHTQKCMLLHRNCHAYNCLPWISVFSNHWHGYICGNEPVKRGKQKLHSLHTYVSHMYIYIIHFQTKCSQIHGTEAQKHVQTCSTSWNSRL